MSSISPLEKRIIEAFPVRPLGRSGKELRRLVEILSDPTPLANVETWKDMVEVLQGDGSIDELPAKIMFFGGSAWRDFVPAWMATIIRMGNANNRSDDLLSCTLATLDPKFLEYPEIFYERTSDLTAEQRNAIAHFVIWAAAEQPLLQEKKAEQFVKRLLKTWPISSPKQ